MKVSKFLEAKINRFNTVSNVKIKINSDSVSCLNLYTEDNRLVASGKLSQIEMVLDALITIKNLENEQEKNKMNNMILINAKALSALEGKLAPTLNNEEALLVLKAMSQRKGLDYDAEEVLERALRYHKNGVVKHIIVNQIYDEVHIALVLDTKECPLPSDLETKQGILAFMYNVDSEWCSENGYILLKKREDGNYYRIR